MTFSLNIVRGILKHYRASDLIDKNSARQYKWIALLPEELSDMEQDIIYVCYMSEAIKRNKMQPEYHYLCIRDRYIDMDEPDENLHGLIIVNENRDIAWLFNLIQKRFLELSAWEKNLQLAIIDHCSYQKLIDISEPILCNFISVLDLSYKLVAYSYNQKCDDPIVMSLLEKGYHSEDTIKKFQTLKRFKLYEEEHGLIIGKPGEISKYEVVSRWSRYGGENLLHTVMVCSNTPLSLELTDLFDVFMRYIDICFQHEQSQNSVPLKIYSALLQNLIYEDLCDSDLIAEQAKRSGIPMTGNFDFFRIVFEDTAIVLIGRFVQELSTYLPFSKIISKDNEVNVLNIYNTPDITEDSLNNTIKILPLLESYKGICGVSEGFSNLSALKNSAIQAARAYNIGLKLSNLGNFWNMNDDVYTTMKALSNHIPRVCHYNDISVYYMLQLSEAGPADMFKNTFYTQAIVKLRELDQENGSNLAEILYCYLFNERSATATGKLLHMHRNNILYHIGRICDLTGLNLDDYWVRLKLMLGFHHLELHAANKIPV